MWYVIAMIKAPTPDEIQFGYDGITQDGPNAAITDDLALIAIRNPLILTWKKRLIATSMTLGMGSNSAENMDIIVTSAYIYGLHMGLHIGEARNKKPIN
jgi:hypothetical protein